MILLMTLDYEISLCYIMAFSRKRVNKCPRLLCDYMSTHQSCIMLLLLLWLIHGLLHQHLLVKHMLLLLLHLETLLHGLILPNEKTIGRTKTKKFQVFLFKVSPIQPFQLL